MPAFVVFQMPPPAAATKNVFDGLGMPTISATRPSKLAGPTVRQRKPARVRESRFCASAAIAMLVRATPARSGTVGKRCIRTPRGGTNWSGNDTVTERRWGSLSGAHGRPNRPLITRESLRVPRQLLTAPAGLLAAARQFRIVRLAGRSRAGQRRVHNRGSEERGYSVDLDSIRTAAKTLIHHHASGR